MRSLAAALRRQPHQILHELVPSPSNSAPPIALASASKRPSPRRNPVPLDRARPAPTLPFSTLSFPAGSAPAAPASHATSPSTSASPNYLDTIGVDALPVPDGLLIPWQADSIRGTIWVTLPHRLAVLRPRRLPRLQSLSCFAALAVRHQAEQRQLTERPPPPAAASMARELAHHINNPLQSLDEYTSYLAAQAPPRRNPFAEQANDDLIKSPPRPGTPPPPQNPPEFKRP